MAKLALAFAHPLSAKLAKMDKLKRGTGTRRLLMKSYTRQYKHPLDQIIAEVAEAAAAIALSQMKATTAVAGATARPLTSMLERQRLLERTQGIWKDRDIDGLQYQMEQREEW